MAHRGNPNSPSIFRRPALFSVARLILFGLLNLPFLRGAPTPFSTWEKVDPLPPRNPQLWIYLVFAMGLVLLGGAFAGLTIALMGQVSFKLFNYDVQEDIVKKRGEGD